MVSFRSLASCLLLASTTALGCQSSQFVQWPQPSDPPEPGTSPQYRVDAAHTGVAPEGTRVDGGLELQWKTAPLAIGDYSASKSSPTVDGERVYIGVDDGQLHAIDVLTAEIVWSFKTHQYQREQEREGSKNRGIHGTAAVDETQVYIGDYRGWLYALDKEDGTMVWESKLGGSIGASPVLYGDYVFMAVEYPDPDGKVFVIDSADGKTIYETISLGNHPHSSVTVDPDRGYMFIGANNGMFYCFDFVTEELVWERSMDDVEHNDIKSTAAVAGDMVYITSWDKKLHAFDIDTGDELWAFEMDDLSMSSPSYHDGVLYVGSHDKRLYAVDAEDGTELWSFDTGRRVLSSPTVVPETGVVLIGSNSDWVHMLDLETGDEVWAHETEGVVSSVPVATGDSLYVNDASGAVWRFAMRN